MNGFNRYKDLVGVTYLPPTPVVLSELPRDKYDDILDMIFAKDANGWPSGAFSQFLSEKTSSEVRQFIQDYLMTGGSESHLDVPDEVLKGYKDLPSDFIAQCSRNRNESVEQYEQRISEYVNQLRQEESFKQRYESYMKSFKKNESD